MTTTAKRSRPYAGETDQHPDPTPGSIDQKRKDRLRAMAPTLIGSLITGTPIPAQEQAALKPSMRTVRRARAAEMRRAAKAEAARRQEAADEAVAPAAQRNAVLDASGEVLRAPRVVRDGIAFVRVSPLAWMAANIEKHGEAATFTQQHFRSATRLVAAWDAVGDGIGLGASDWGSLRGSRGTAPTTPAGHSALVAQVEQRLEIDAAHTWMGSLWPCLEDIALRGMTPTAWAASVGMDRKAAPGYLLAALDRLVEFYAARDHVPDRPTRIRTVAVAERAMSETC